MVPLRGMLVRVAMALVLSQAAAWSFATASLWPGPLPVRMECTCIHNDHAVCPMHHGRTAGTRRCAIGAAAQVPTGILVSALDIGLPVAGTVTSSAAEPPMAFPPGAPAYALRRQPPDSPPPRV